MFSNVLRLLAGILFGGGVVLVVGFPLFLVAVAAAGVVRRRVPRPVLAALVAAAFASTAGYALYRIEWYDVWRHGLPSLPYVAAVYLPYLLVFGALGWWAGRSLASSQHPLGRG